MRQELIAVSPTLFLMVCLIFCFFCVMIKSIGRENRLSDVRKGQCFVCLHPIYHHDEEDEACRDCARTDEPGPCAWGDDFL